MSSYGDNSTALPVVVFDMETKERIRVGNLFCRIQKRGVENSFLNRLGGLGSGSGSLGSGRTGLGLEEA